VASDLSRTEVKEEGNLLIEAVALLVQRQRETESWVAEQIWQAEERAAATDRRYAELEARLEGIEEHLARLVHEIEPARGDPAADERLARLREQVEGLKITPSTAGQSARGGPLPSVSSEYAAPPGADISLPPREPEGARPVAPAEPRYQRQAVAAPGSGGSSSGVTFWDLLGPSPQDRFGLVLIGAGAVAVLYAILTQLRFS
jgi:hypothetical protein